MAVGVGVAVAVGRLGDATANEAGLGVGDGAETVGVAVGSGVTVAVGRTEVAVGSTGAAVGGGVGSTVGVGGAIGEGGTCVGIAVGNGVAVAVVPMPCGTNPRIDSWMTSAKLEKRVMPDTVIETLPSSRVCNT